MEGEEVLKLKDNLGKYSSELNRLKEDNFKKKSMDEFKEYYNETHASLVTYIRFSKNKRISEIAKQLPLLKDMLSSFNKYVAILIFVSLSSISAIVYLYTMNTTDYILGIIGFNVIAAFFLVKKIQTQPAILEEQLTSIKPIFSKILSMMGNKI